MPTDYEICDTCKCDHTYEWEFLSEEERLSAIAAHIEAGDMEE